jgi:hypothetical protein
MFCVAMVTQILLVPGRTEISFEELVLWVEQSLCIYSCLSSLEFLMNMAIKISLRGCEVL